MSCTNVDCCRDMAHTMEAKVCKNCSKEIQTWGCQLCSSCAVRLNQCDHCRTDTGGTDLTQ